MQRRELRTHFPAHFEPGLGCHLIPPALPELLVDPLRPDPQVRQIHRDGVPEGSPESNRRPVIRPRASSRSSNASCERSSKGRKAG